MSRFNGSKLSFSISGLSMLLGLVAAAFFQSCSGGSSGTTSTSGTALDNTYPENVAVTSPLAGSSSASAKLRGSVRMKEESEVLVEPDDLAAKGAIVRGLLEATDVAACKISLRALHNPPQLSCYGPQVTYSNHPDGPDQLPPQLPQGDLGIFTADETITLPDTTTKTLPCTVAVINQRMRYFEGRADLAMQIPAFAICANKTLGSAALPEVGEEVDLTSIANQAANKNSLPILFETATVKQLDSTADGFKVFESHTKVTITEEISGKSVTADITLTHSPRSDDGAQGLGRIKVLISHDRIGNQCPNTATTETKAMAIRYQNTASERRLLVTDANYCDSVDETAAFTVNHDVNPEDNNSPTNTDGWHHNYNVLRATEDTSSGVKIAIIGWQAGGQDGFVRTMNATTTKAADGSRTGTGYFGFIPTADILTTDHADRMICNWAGPNNNHTGVSKLQRQTFSRALAAGWVTDSNNITYAPTNSCDALAGFSYGTPSDTRNGPITNDLVRYQRYFVHRANRPGYVLSGGILSA